MISAQQGANFPQRLWPLVTAGALAWAVKVSDGKLRGRAFKAKTRPACVMAGGKTRRFQ